jgi:4a-hydroxytetrahydrobiopterin dehydratase
MPDQNPLTPHEAQDLMARVPDWTLGEGVIARTLSFPAFRDAVAFVNAVADLAEEVQHHPEITIAYRNVHLLLSTHAAGGLTPKDFALAQRIDTLAMRKAA